MPHAAAPHLTAADRVIGALAFAAGSADVFAFVRFHDVFTSAMTGNTALLGLALGRGHLVAASRSLAALSGFSVGAAGATLIVDSGARLGEATRMTRVLRRLLGAEFGLLLLVALSWTLAPMPVHHTLLYALIITASMAMGVQSVAARLIDVPGIPTVVFTTTLTMIMMALTRMIRQRGARNPRTAPVSGLLTLRQIGAMGLYFGGAAMTGVANFARPPIAVWLAVAAVVVAYHAARGVRDQTSKPR